MHYLRYSANARRDRRRRRGQSIVEFALVIPVFLVIVMFGIDFGRAFLGWVDLQNAARIGANYAALHPTANWANPADPDVIKYTALVTNELSTTNCPVGSVAEPTFSSTSLGGNATVALTCQFRIITPIITTGIGFIGPILPNPLNIGASAVFPVRSGTYGAVVPTPTPTPVPTATPTPTATPAPTPTPCTLAAPQLVGQRKNDAAGLWSGAGFTGTVTTLPGTGNYVIGSQDKIAGQQYPCNSSVTVGP